MCHLEEETSCSFHTFSVLAPEPGITCVLCRLYLEFVASLETPPRTPRCCMTHVLSSVWQTHTSSNLWNGSRPALLFKSIHLGLMARWFPEPFGFEHQMSIHRDITWRTKRDGDVDFSEGAAFQAGGLQEKGCRLLEPSCLALDLPLPCRPPSQFPKSHLGLSCVVLEAPRWM